MRRKDVRQGNVLGGIYVFHYLVRIVPSTILRHILLSRPILFLKCRLRLLDREEDYKLSSAAVS